jgi:5'-nucleotidase / UDP-sugar diphosphatase
MNSKSFVDVGREFEAFCRLCAKAFVLVLAVAFLAVAPASNGFAASKGKTVLLTINDVYRITGINDGKDGGMARVRALRAELERTAPDLLFLHGGDFLSPSFLGRTYAGAQMIDLMNVLDGNFNSGAHDERMFVVFGNHEFDDTHCGKKGPLSNLVSASEFTWLASNIDFARCKNLSALSDKQNIVRNRIIESGGLRIGLYGLTMAKPKYAAVIADPVETSCRQVRNLRAQGVDVVVALTHLPWTMDLQLLGRARSQSSKPLQKPNCAPDVIVGGHDHVSIAMPKNAPRLFKADADALSAWVIEIDKGSDGKLKVGGRLVYLNDARPKDPAVQRLAGSWLVRHDERFCMRDCIGKAKQELKRCLKSVDSGACLKQPIARTNAEIETEEIANRSFETGFGNWITDQMRKAGAAEVAFLNAGAIRLNYNLKKGAMITRRHLAQMFPFKNKLVVRDLPGGAIWHAVEHAVKHRGEGAWAHFSGMAVRLTGAQGKQQVAQVLVQKPDGKFLEITSRSTETVRVASLSFVFANGDGHGFNLCPGVTNVWRCKDQLELKPRWPLGGDQSDLAGFVRHKLGEFGAKDGLHLSTDRRLCDPRQTSCLIDRWLSKK